MTRPIAPPSQQRYQIIQYRPDPSQPARWVRPRIRYILPNHPGEIEPWSGGPTGWAHVEMDPTETEGHFTSKYPIIFRSPFGAGITPGAQTPMQHIELTLGLRNNEPRPVADIPMPVAVPGFPAQLQQQFMNNGPGMQLPDGSNQYVFPGMGPSGPPMHSLDLISMSQAMQAEPMHPQPMHPQPVMHQPMHPQPGLPTPDSNEINVLDAGEIETEAEMSAVAADPALQQEQQNVPAEAQFEDFDLDDPAFFEFSVDGPTIGNQ